jgi:hypothetical protein
VDRGIDSWFLRDEPVSLQGSLTASTSSSICRHRLCMPLRLQEFKQSMLCYVLQSSYRPDGPQRLSLHSFVSQIDLGKNDVHIINVS